MNKDTFYSSAIIAFLYTGVGTLALLSAYPDFILSGEWAIFGMVLTFPVSIIGFGIRYASKDAYLGFFITQFVMFLLAWRFVYWYWERRHGGGGN